MFFAMPRGTVYTRSGWITHSNESAIKIIKEAILSRLSRLGIAVFCMFLFDAAAAANLEVTFAGSITSASDADGLPEYGLGVGEEVNFRIHINHQAQGYRDIGGNISYISDWHDDCTNPGDPYCGQGSNYFYANYLDGSFLTDPSLMATPSDTAYYAVDGHYEDRYGSYYWTTVTLLTNLNRLTLETNYDYSFYGICFSCIGERIYFKQAITGQGTIYGSAQITSFVDLGSEPPPPWEPVPVLPAHWLLMSGIATLGALSRSRKSRGG